MRSLLAHGHGRLRASGGQAQCCLPAFPMRTTGLMTQLRHLPGQYAALPRQPQLLRVQPASASAGNMPQGAAPFLDPAPPPAPAEATSTLDNVFFTGFKTEGIKQCMRLAEEEARAMQHALIQPAHFLLACLRLPELQQQALQGVQLSVDDVRAVLRMGLAEQQHIDKHWVSQAAPYLPAALLPHPLSEATRDLLHRAFLLALSRGRADLSPSDLLHCLTAGQQDTVDITHAPLAYAYMRLVPEAALLKDTLVHMLVNGIEVRMLDVQPDPQYLYGTYKWSIENLEELSQSGAAVRSVEFHAAGHKWSLKARCLQADDNKSEQEVEVTLFPVDESVNADHVMNIMNWKNSSHVLTCGAFDTLVMYAPGHGWWYRGAPYVSTLMDPANGWLKDGALTVEVHIKVDKANLSSAPPVTPTPVAALPPSLVHAATNMTSVADVAQVLSAYLDLGLTPDQATCQAAAAILQSPTAAEQVKECLTRIQVVQLLRGMMALQTTSFNTKNSTQLTYLRDMLTACLVSVWDVGVTDWRLWGGNDGITWREASAVMQALAHWKPLLPDELTAQVTEPPSATSSIYTWYARDLQQGDVMWRKLLDAVSTGEPWQEVASCFKSLQMLGAICMHHRGLQLAEAALESPLVSTADKAAAVHQLATLCEVSAEQRDWVQLMADHNLVQLSTLAYLIKLLTPAGRQPISTAAAVMPAGECMQLMMVVAAACTSHDHPDPQLRLKLAQPLPGWLPKAVPSAALQLLDDSRKLQLISPQAYRALMAYIQPALAQPDLTLEQLPWKDDLKQVLQTCIPPLAPVSSPVIRAEDQSEVFSLQDVHAYLVVTQCSEQLKETLHTAALPDSIQAILDAAASAQSADSKAGLWCRVLQLLPGLEAPSIAAVLLKCEAAGLVSKQEAVTSLCVLVDPGTALVQDSLQPCLAALIHLTKGDPGMSQLPVFKTWLDRARHATVNELWAEHVMVGRAAAAPRDNLPLLQLLPFIRHLDSSAVIALGTIPQTTLLALDSEFNAPAAPHGLWCLSTAWTSDPCPQLQQHGTKREALLACMKSSLTRGPRAVLQLAAAACQFKHAAETQASPGLVHFLADACQEVVWSVGAAQINNLTNEELMMMGAMAVLLKPAGPLAADHPSITHLQLLISQLEACQADGRLVISTEVEPAAAAAGGRGSAAAAPSPSHITSAIAQARWNSVLQAMKMVLSKVLPAHSD